MNFNTQEQRKEFELAINMFLDISIDYELNADCNYADPEIQKRWLFWSLGASNTIQLANAEYNILNIKYQALLNSKELANTYLASDCNTLC